MRVEEISPNGQTLVGRDGQELVLYWPKGEESIKVSRELFESLVRQSEEHAAFGIYLEIIAKSRWPWRARARKIAREALAWPSG